MIELTRRQRQCLQFLCRREAFATTDEIARHLSVSARTVRTELNVVDAFAREHGCALERVPGSGVRIAPTKGIARRCLPPSRPPKVMPTA